MHLDMSNFIPSADCAACLGNQKYITFARLAAHVKGETGNLRIKKALSTKRFRLRREGYH